MAHICPFDLVHTPSPYTHALAPSCIPQEAPIGHPDCLTGKTIVITGVLDSLMRHEADALVKRHGGRVTGSVSGKTTFLLAGHDCGRSKFRTVRRPPVRALPGWALQGRAAHRPLPSQHAGGMPRAHPRRLWTPCPPPPHLSPLRAAPHCSYR